MKIDPDLSSVYTVSTQKESDLVYHKGLLCLTDGSIDLVCCPYKAHDLATSGNSNVQRVPKDSRTHSELAWPKGTWH